LGSKAQDSTTQKASSAGAQSTDSTLDANAAQNQTFANNARTTLFGTYSPTTGKYSGGTQSQFLNPSSMNTTGLTGSYQNLYSTQANQQAQAAKDGVATSEQNQAAHGMGETPAGYSANQEREAYQTQAANNGANYAQDFGNQHAEAVTNYNNANDLLNSNATNTANLSEAGNTAAAGNYSNLYGTASTPVPTALGTVLGTVGTLAGAAGQAFQGAGTKAICWVAAEIFDGWDDPRTSVVRGWLLGDFSRLRIGRAITDLYRKYGEELAAAIRKYRPLRWIFTPILHLALRAARKGK
jgi:hypothetical protein